MDKILDYVFKTQILPILWEGP